MTRWFKHVAVIAAWLGLAAPVVLAQPGYPATVGAARQIGPLHYVPEGPPPNLAPGPVNPLVAPAGPPPSLNLPADHTNAFPAEGFPPENRSYGSIGYQLLRRGELASKNIVFDSPALNPVGRLPVAFRLDSLEPKYAPGFRATLGYLYGNEAFELSGFYQPDSNEFRDVTDRLSLFIPFTNAPAGFEGGVGMWQNADYVKINHAIAVGSGELNYRRWDIGLSGTEWIMGVRYFHSQERISIFTSDNLLTIQDTNGNPLPEFEATYAAMVRTNHVGLQFGFDWSNPIPCDPFSWIWLTTTAKMSAGFNFIERSWRLTRPDGLTGFDIHKNDIEVGSVMELGAFLDFHLLERMRFRGGYQYLLAISFPDAASQIGFDLANQGNISADKGYISFHGPVLELQFLW